MHDISLFFQTKYILFFIIHDKFLFLQSLHLYTYYHVVYLIKNNYFHTMHDIFLFTYYLSNDNGISVKKKKAA